MYDIKIILEKNIYFVDKIFFKKYQKMCEKHKYNEIKKMLVECDKFNDLKDILEKSESLVEKCNFYENVNL